MPGKTLRIHLADGTPSGIRHGEIVSWTGQAIACPRTRFSELKKDWKEIYRPGVYFLFGYDDKKERDVVYVGESERVIDRIDLHASDSGGKEFWNQLVIFTSKDDNLTKTHVKYLEARLIKLISTAGRFLQNSVSPQLPTLSRAEQSDMEEFIEGIRILLGALGYKVLEPLVDKLPRSSESSKESIVIKNELLKSYGLVLRVGGIQANALWTDEGIVVLSGSEVNREMRSSLSLGYRSMREHLINSGVINEVDGKLKFSKDNLFSSPSQAAAVIVGYSINGRGEWKSVDSGISLGDLEKSLAH